MREKFYRIHGGRSRSIRIDIFKLVGNFKTSEFVAMDYEVVVSKIGWMSIILSAK